MEWLGADIVDAAEENVISQVNQSTEESEEDSLPQGERSEDPVIPDPISGTINLKDVLPDIAVSPASQEELLSKQVEIEPTKLEPRKRFNSDGIQRLFETLFRDSSHCLDGNDLSTNAENHLDEVAAIDAHVWFEIARWASHAKCLYVADALLAHNLGEKRKLGVLPTAQAKQGKRIIEDALLKGFKLPVKYHE
jgi:hypothetical protein